MNQSQLQTQKKDEFNHYLGEQQVDKNGNKYQYIGENNWQLQK